MGIFREWLFVWKKTFSARKDMGVVTTCYHYMTKLLKYWCGNLLTGLAEHRRAI